MDSAIIKEQEKKKKEGEKNEQLTIRKIPQVFVYKVAQNQCISANSVLKCDTMVNAITRIHAFSYVLCLRKNSIN